MKHLAVLLALVASLAACGPQSPSRSQSQGTHTMEIDGRTRTYIVYRPPTLPGKPAPLVVMLHGGFGSASQAESYYGWDASADRNHFVVVYPDGVRAAWNAGGGCCGTPASQGIDDVAYISRVVHEVSATMPIDPRRVYATGISNGGLMAYRMACDTTLFAAIGPDSATMLGDCPAPHPLSVIHIHGTSDTRIPYGGGQGNGFAKIDGPPVPDVIARWRKTDGCAPPAVTTAPPVTTSTATCPDGRAVELVTIAGAGHQWPGGAAKPILQRVADLDPPSTALDATDTIWRFFAAHPRC